MAHASKQGPLIGLFGLLEVGVDRGQPQGKTSDLLLVPQIHELSLTTAVDKH